MRGNVKNPRQNTSDKLLPCLPDPEPVRNLLDLPRDVYVGEERPIVGDCGVAELAVTTDVFKLDEDALDVDAGAGSMWRWERKSERKLLVGGVGAGAGAEGPFDERRRGEGGSTPS